MAIDFGNIFISRSKEVRRRNRQERLQKTQETINRMKTKQKEMEVWNETKDQAMPYIYGVGAIVILAGAYYVYGALFG